MKWRVQDFKGIVDCELDLSADSTTILTGTNSSGKTSLLQSLLLLRQSGQSGDGIVLNGPLVRLGNSSDLIRDGASTNAAKFTIANSQGRYEFHIRSVATDRKRQAESAIIGSEMQICKLKISNVQADAIDTPSLLLSQDHLNKEDIATIRSMFGVSADISILHLKADGKRLAKAKHSRTYFLFNGLRCVKIIKLYPEEQLRRNYRKLLQTSISQVRPSWQSGNPSDSPQRNALPDGILLDLLSFDLDDGQIKDDPTSTRRERARATRRDVSRARNVRDFARTLVAMNDKQIDFIVDRAVSRRSEFPAVSIDLNLAYGTRFRTWGITDRNGVLEFSLWESCREILLEVEQFTDCWMELRKRIEYIGPLRDEPRVVSGQWNSETLGLPVGSRGELTANYYTKNRDRKIMYRTPPEHSKKSNATLSTAVSEWLEYLQLGSKIDVEGYGKIGVGLKVTWNGKPRDLTSLGVGVSQAVPIVIASLAAPPSSIFIVEQPELHLHPDVQARLGDFFIYARPDVNFVIETHSDSLVTRVRRRIAEQKISPSAVHLTFVEDLSGAQSSSSKDRLHSKGAKSRTIQFTRLGDLSEWPVGFIGSSLEDSQAIMAATLTELGRKGEQ